jgi:MOSC domain-containing protein YiiM
MRDADANAAPRLAAVLLGPRGGPFETQRQDRLSVDWGGVVGDRHHGRTVAATPFNRPFPPGVPIRNRRQVSAVSVEELAEMARLLGIAEVRPEWLAANLLIEGAPDLSRWPAGVTLLFPSGAGLTVEAANDPCRTAGGAVRRAVGGPEDLAAAFVKAAYGRRGLVLSVECEGELRAGDLVQVDLPAWRTAGHA